MYSPLSAIHEYGFSSYAAKELIAHSRLGRKAYELTAITRAFNARRKERWYEYARIVSETTRILEGHSIGAALAREYARVLSMTSDSGPRDSSPSEIVRSFLNSPAGEAERMRYGRHDVPHAVSMKVPRAHDVESRQGNLLVLKAASPTSREKGVLYLQYTESALPFIAMFDVEKLSANYRLVFEPSSWGYGGINFVLLAGSGIDVVVQAQDAIDYEICQKLGPRITPLRLGAGDWIDGSAFSPQVSPQKEFDFVMVASWSPLKRHPVFFEALRKADLHGSRVALIGYPWEGRDRGDMEDLISRYGLSNVQIFESIPRTEVANIISRSSVGVMLTRREGANRGLYECLFCDVPVILYRENRGVNKALINEHTGFLASDRELPFVLRQALSEANTTTPRLWALRNTGHINAWRILNDCLRARAESCGEPYTRPISQIVSTPNAAYVINDDVRNLKPEYRRLAEYLRRA